MFDVETQAEVEVLSIMLRSIEVTIRSKAVLSKENFRNPLTEWFFTEICSYVGAYKDSLLPKKVIFHKIRSGDVDLIEERFEFAKSLYKIAEKLSDEDLKNVDYFFDQIIKIKIHCDQCLLVSKLAEKAEEMDTSAFQEILKGYDKEVYNSIAVPKDFVSEFEERFNKKSDEVVRSLRLNLHDGKNDIDSILKHSLKPDQGLFATVIGGTGVGKTHFMLHVAVEAALQRFNVLQVAFEGDEARIQAQLDSRSSGILVDDIYENNLTEEQKKTLKTKLDRIKGKIYFKFLESDAYTFNDLSALKADIERRDNVAINVVLVSQIYNLKPSEKETGDDRTRLNKVRLYNEGRNFAKRGRKSLLIVEDQPRTVSLANKSFVREDIREASGVSSELDYMFGICQTPGEQRRNRLRFQMIKARGAENKGVEIKLRNDFSRARYLNGWNE